MSAEDWLEKVESIVQAYRLGVAQEGADTAQILTKAMNDLQSMDLTQGEAVRYLKPHLKGT